MRTASITFDVFGWIVLPQRWFSRWGGVHASLTHTLRKSRDMSSQQAWSHPHLWIHVLICAALINLLKFLLSNETSLLAKHNIFHLALLVGSTHSCETCRQDYSPQDRISFSHLVSFVVTKFHCLLMQVVNLFNMFITYGDTFLPTSNSYDELYYEIVRMHQVFDNLYCMGRSVSEYTKLFWSKSWSFILYLIFLFR